MFTPNHIVVTVASARNLPSKGKTGKVDAFVVIQLGETKFQTSVKTKSVTPVWDEECEFFLPNKYSLLVLHVYHRTFLGLDELLGQVRLPLDEVIELNEKPRNRYYPLKGKSGKKDEHKYRGELEVRLEFAHKPTALIANVDNPRKTSATDKQSSLRDIKSAVKHVFSNKKDSDKSQTTSDELTQEDQLKHVNSLPSLVAARSRSATLPAGSALNKDDDGGKFNSLRTSQRNTSFSDFPATGENRTVLEPLEEDESNKSSEEYDDNVQSSHDHTKTVKSFAPRYQPQRSSASAKLKSYSSAVNVAGVDLIYETMTKQDLIEVVNEQRIQMGRQERRIRELEDYIDQLVVRVMNAQPTLLQGPFFVEKTKWKF